MRNLVHTTITASAMAALLLLAAAPVASQTAAYRAPRAADGHADMGGIWQAVNSANWDLEDHSAQPGTMWQTGSIGAEPAGQSVVEGGAIPYKPEKLAKKKDNFANRRTNDPEAKCYMPGVPRANYMPYPFQIVQSPKGILLVYEFASANRFVNMGKPEEAGSDTWMGTNNGHWEGDTLVIDVTGLNGLAWFDRAGDFASNQLHVVERYTRVDPYHINYEATIEDPSVFTRPWKISMPLYKVDKNAQLLDFKCVEFSEELLYGQFKKQTRQIRSRLHDHPTYSVHNRLAGFFSAPGTNPQSPRQAVKTWTPPKTPWGDPDLQGMWPGNMGVPMQRPEALGTRATLTDAEFAQKEAQAKRQAQADSQSTVASDSVGIGPPSYWTERGTPHAKPR